MIIDGPTTKRDDGSERCIGFGIDSNGRVTDRFALPKGFDWDHPQATVTVEFVHSMDDLPPIDDYYRKQF